jgi:hypothetical protein
VKHSVPDLVVNSAFVSNRSRTAEEVIAVGVRDLATRTFGSTKIGGDDGEAELAVEGKRENVIVDAKARLLTRKAVEGEAGNGGEKAGEGQAAFRRTGRRKNGKVKELEMMVHGTEAAFSWRLFKVLSKCGAILREKNRKDLGEVGAEKGKGFKGGRAPVGKRASVDGRKGNSAAIGHRNASDGIMDGAGEREDKGRNSRGGRIAMSNATDTDRSVGELKGVGR